MCNNKDLVENDKKSEKNINSTDLDLILNSKSMKNIGDKPNIPNIPKIPNSEKNNSGQHNSLKKNKSNNLKKIIISILRE
jgi:hypothetical protein